MRGESGQADALRNCAALASIGLRRNEYGLYQTGRRSESDGEDQDQQGLTPRGRAADRQAGLTPNANWLYAQMGFNF